LPSRVAISSGFGLREHPISGHLDFHQGIDLPAAAGTPILAAFSGRAISVGATGDLGIAVVLEHDDNRRTRYGHMLIAAVSPNAWVNRGDTIGFVGSTGNSTGPHLHFEYWEQQSDLTWVVLDMEDRLAMADIGVDALAASPLPQPDTTPLAAGGAEHRVEIELDCLDLTLR
jgi:murein DD-endopeptidase MepM/ murein hydrolase activator NlpD